MFFFKKIFKLFFILCFLTVFGCEKYSNLSNTERLVNYKFFSDDVKIYIEKFYDKADQWFKATCITVSSHPCINIEFTNVSKFKIANLLTENNNTNNQTTNLSNTSLSNEEEYEREGEEEEEEEGEEEEGEEEEE